MEGELPGYSELAGFSCCSSASSCPSPHREVTWAREDFRATLGLCLQVWLPKTRLVGLYVGSKGFGFSVSTAAKPKASSILAINFSQPSHVM